MHKQSKIRIILLVCASILAILLLLASAVLSGKSYNDVTSSAEIESSIVHPDAGGDIDGDDGRAMTAAEACMQVAPAALQAWTDQSEDGDALLAETFVHSAILDLGEPETMPDLPRSDWRAGLLSGGEDTAVCSVYAGGDLPWTVGLTRTDDGWLANVIMQPGETSGNPSTGDSHDEQ
ncbi:MULTISPECIES: hypothetical protein [Bifidobacterium]|uniref:Cobalt transporter n=2 Tax=Bifidobacterium TaxID=1678 RepID=A0A261FP27_9BIFI|nr:MULTISPECIES: hypothetical protein [Bifidobacterium]OZG60723.1 hypothetical protein BLEM_1692 [Bifidobacterium lemurum]OZG69621.1 hypothetical protein BEUL_0038 [Bifidobacterium eulemuris]QOL32263.1 hypothetical protein BE0216_07200 [Bifidobacterium eulemuris]QOL35223.1 hypothetical protein BL8807_05065 [Bifidobacterium lemurum]